MISLYPDQHMFVKDLRAALRTHQSVLAHAATGFGKTVVAAYIAREASERQKRIVFAVHRRNLITQSARTFSSFDIQFGFIAAGKAEAFHYPIQIASIETLRRRLDRIPRVDLLYIDECHMACSRTWSEVIDHFRARGARVIGNTATPCRLDGRPLGQHFDVIVPGPPVRDLIDAGRLSDYRLFAPSAPDLSGVHSRNGDYVAAELEVVMDTSRIVGDAAAHYKRIMPGKRAIAFCVSIRASKNAAQQFRAAGIRAAHIDGETPDDERRRLIAAFASGEITVLCNVELITTGFDLSAQVGRDVPVEGAIMLRPTQSLALWLQMVGRALRAKPYPAIIADHTGSSLVHGLPDQERDWSLGGAQKRKKAAAAGPAIRSCTECFAVYSASRDACPACGTVISTGGGRDLMPEQVDGELQEVDIQQARWNRRKEEGRARTLEELVTLARSRGYAKGAEWAAIRYSLRTGVSRADAINEARKLWQATA